MSVSFGVPRSGLFKQLTLKTAWRASTSVLSSPGLTGERAVVVTTDPTLPRKPGRQGGGARSSPATTPARPGQPDKNPPKQHAAINSARRAHPLISVPNNIVGDLNGFSGDLPK